MQGRVIADRYQLLTKVGQGGMGTVWQAEDLTLRIAVAIKLADPIVAESTEALARFEREALAAAKLHSTHIVHINDYGISEDTPYIVMDLLQGESLADRLDREGKLPFAETVCILSQVAQALGVAHANRIVHRDLKPENVFITLEGGVEVVKVLDFGVAKKLDIRSPHSNIETWCGELLGTPSYMSPEQARGKIELDERSDIWSLGVVAYECVIGRLPFDDDTLAGLLLSICTEAPLAPSQLASVPPGFDAWFARATELDRDKRFASAIEAMNALNSVNGPLSETPSAALGDVKGTSLSAASGAVPIPDSMKSVQPPAVSTAGNTRRVMMSKRAGVSLYAMAIVVGVACIAWSSRPLPAPSPTSCVRVLEGPESAALSSSDVPAFMASSALVTTAVSATVHAASAPPVASSSTHSPTSDGSSEVQNNQGPKRVSLPARAANEKPKRVAPVAVWRRTVNPSGI